MKANGQGEPFNGYGGIEDLGLYVATEYGAAWKLHKLQTLTGIGTFTQGRCEAGAPNCTLASIARIMLYHAGRGWNGIPDDLNEVYRVVRKIGVAHGYDPGESGIIRDIFIYTPFEIDNMVRDAWEAFGYPKGIGDNDYFKKWRTIREQIDLNQPLLLSMSIGDYEGHTVSVTGYAIYRNGQDCEKEFVQVLDGWSETVRYVDWDKFGIIPANITKIIPPEVDRQEKKP